MFKKFFRRGRTGSDGEQGRGLAKGTKPGSGPRGDCICPKCGQKVQHQVGQRCMDLNCPKCGTPMVRE